MAIKKFGKKLKKAGKDNVLVKYAACCVQYCLLLKRMYDTCGDWCSRNHVGTVAAGMLL